MSSKVDKVFWIANIPENINDLIVEPHDPNGIRVRSDSAIIKTLHGTNPYGLASAISSLCKGFYHRGYVRAQRDMRRSMGVKD